MQEKEKCIMQTNVLAVIDTMQTRRSFCVNVCRFSSLVAFGGILPQLLSCSENSTTPEPIPGLPTIQATLSQNRTLTLTIDANSPLSPVGSAAMIQYSGGAILVARTAQDAFTAVTATCTHQGCTITGFRNQRYVCPCHGSQFHTSGQVAQGPAGSPLRSFPTQFSNDVLTISGL